MPTSLSAVPGILTVELDPQAVAAGQRPPAALDQQGAEALAAGIAADLERAVGVSAGGFGLVVPAALYDLTELLQPGLPLLGVLADLYRAGQGQGFAPGVLALGARDGRLPVGGLEPRRAPGSGPMLATPFMLVGLEGEIERLQRRMESELLRQGRASAQTAAVVRERFEAPALNLVYCTVSDVCALMKAQLEAHGFAELWTLVEPALHGGDRRARVALEEGNELVLAGGTVYTPFWTLSQWAARHGSDDPVPGYRRWLMRQRQLSAGLWAHGLRVQPLAAPLELPDSGEATLERALGACLASLEVLREGDRADAADPAAELVLTEHGDPELGPVAFTAEGYDEGRRLLWRTHSYPLVPGAIAALREEWSAHADEHGVALVTRQPGTILWDPAEGLVGASPGPL